MHESFDKKNLFDKSDEIWKKLAIKQKINSDLMFQNKKISKR